MPKKPDLSDLAKKFDISGIVDSIKSVINPEGHIPEVDPNDAIGMKLAQISAMMQQLGEAQTQQAKDMVKVHKLLNELYKDIEALRAEHVGGKPKAQSEARQTKQEATTPPKPKPKHRKARSEDTSGESH